MFILILALAGTPVIVSGGSQIDYQPSPLQNTDGSLIVAFERLTPPSQGFIGDIMVTTSADTGSTWTTPTVVVDGAANQRHPALVHVSSGGYRVFYLSDESGGYDIYSAFSNDGEIWTEEGVVNLGWTSGSFGNPTVTAEGDTALVMSYDRFFGQGGFVARSTDGGATWDTGMRRINQIGRLNRIIRHPDGTWLCSWQETGGGTVVNIFASYSSDLETWAPSESLTTNDNGHDSMPFVDADQNGWIYYAKHDGTVYRVMRRSVPSWGTYGQETLVYEDVHNSTQPHPLLLSDGRIALFWGSWWAGYDESDVMMEIFDYTGVEERHESEYPMSLALSSTPFTGSLTIEVRASETVSGSLKVYDLSGRIVDSVISNQSLNGVHYWVPDENLPAGSYVILAAAGEHRAAGRCVYLP